MEGSPCSSRPMQLEGSSSQEGAGRRRASQQRSWGQGQRQSHRAWRGVSGNCPGPSAVHDQDGVAACWRIAHHEERVGQQR